jgi:hypothetical protein
MICVHCKRAADTDDMVLHTLCRPSSGCSCQHRHPNSERDNDGTRSTQQKDTDGASVSSSR